MKLPSPSKLSLAYKCSHPFTSGIKWPYEPDSAFSSYGKAVHKAGELLGTGAHLDFDAIAKSYLLTDDEKKRLIRDARSIAHYLEERLDGWAWLRCEIIVCYDTATGNARTIKEFRDRRSTEILGVIDLLAQRHDGRLVVVDYKTGAQRATAEAQNNPQLSILALMAARIYGADSATVSLAYIDDNGIWSDTAELDCFAIDAAEDAIQTWVRENSKGPTSPVPGTHCTRGFCPLVGVCSATRGALAQAVTPFSLDLSSDKEALRVLRLLPMAEAALDKVRKTVEARARERPIPLEDGKVFGLTSYTCAAINNLTRDDEAILHEILGPEADEVIKRTSKVTKADIGDLIAARVRGGKRGAIKAAKDATFAELKTRGLMRETTIQVLKEHDPND